MRKPPLIPTKRQRVVACVLLVGNEPGLEDLCRVCMEFTGEARLVVSDVATMTTRAAQWRPFAIVVSSSIAEFDPDEFAALARSVDAHLLTVPSERIADPLLKNALITAFRNAFERRKSSR
jgi:hypothetical protein